MSGEISIREDLLKEYISEKINRKNYLYKTLYKSSGAYSKNEMKARLELFDEYESITEMFNYINIFSSDIFIDDYCDRSNIKII